jgi:hypothetical protein
MASAFDDKGGWHGQRPYTITIARWQIMTSLPIDRPDGIRQREAERGNEITADIRKPMK